MAANGSPKPSKAEGISLPSLDSSQEKLPPSPDPFAEKVQEILEACSNKNLAVLIEHASSKGGFVNDDVRKIACK